MTDKVAGNSHIIVLPFSHSSKVLKLLLWACWQGAAKGLPGSCCSCAGQEERVFYLNAFAADAADGLRQLTVKPGSVARPITCMGWAQLQASSCAELIPHPQKSLDQISRSWDLFSKEDLVMTLREHRDSSCWIMALLWAYVEDVWRKAK